MLTNVLGALVGRASAHGSLSSEAAVESLTGAERSVDPERLLGYTQLLAQPDEPPLRGRRGHHVTQTGARDRWLRTWLPVARCWQEHRIAASVGPLDGWKSAAVTRLYRVRRGSDGLVEAAHLPRTTAELQLKVRTERERK